MKILVTGGAGFIGSNLIDVLMKQGHQITVIDNLSVGKASNIEHHLESDNFQFVNDSILNVSTLERLIRQTDLIYHLAAVVGPKYVVEDPLGTIVTNVRGTENVLELAFKYWVRTVIASSSEIYGKSTAVPLSEDDDRILGSTIVGRWSYSDAKAIDEYFALAYAKKGLPVAAVRYFNAYGPRLDPRGYGSVIARFITQALRGEPMTIYDDGEQTRCFTYVTDTLAGTIKAATVREAAGLVFNIGSNRETSVNELAQLIRQLTGSRSEIVHVPYTSTFGPHFEETRRRVPDVTRARDVLGFEAQTVLEEGLQRTVDWFRKSTDWEIERPGSVS
ncbi:MAG: GDP-mannose 4,6-dehydratase [Chloroflexi bacterium]|nr:GDP-mannose 4,6-dehydratase [Chloroflexota bacterium]